MLKHKDKSSISNPKPRLPWSRASSTRSGATSQLTWGSPRRRWRWKQRLSMAASLRDMQWGWIWLQRQGLEDLWKSWATYWCIRSHDNKRAVFLGNLDFKVQEDEVIRIDINGCIMVLLSLILIHIVVTLSLTKLSEGAGLVCKMWRSGKCETGEKLNLLGFFL